MVYIKRLECITNVEERKKQVCRFQLMNKQLSLTLRGLLKPIPPFTCCTFFFSISIMKPSNRLLTKCLKLYAFLSIKGMNAQCTHKEKWEVAGIIVITIILFCVVFRLNHKWSHLQRASHDVTAYERGRS